ncbi:MAG: DNA topoisomerase [Benjaminiella poitrasii]|nr:MAG: DNA topoisomerase [Benjaminiella poitrasii]
MSNCKVLMVAEKPSLAESLSRLLAPNGQFVTTRKGATPIHEWQGTFNNQPAEFCFTSVTGHVYGLDFTQAHNSWEIDPLQLFDAQTIKHETNPKMRLTQHLQQLAKHSSHLVLWLDCDREGENICFEVISICAPHIKLSNVFRAKFSAITKQDVQRAMNHLGKPNENESKAVDARQEFDLKVGVAFTRFQTRFFQGKYGDLDATVISYGPCQTPTLSFCVERHDAIQGFQPEPFWTIDLRVGANKAKLNWLRGRIFDRQIGTMFFNRVMDAKSAGANFVEMLKHCSAGLGISPSECMSIAERLYMQGYISYPRTETTKYPDNFNIDHVLQEQASHPYWGEHCEELLKNGYDRPTGGTDIGDHPPITPTRIAYEDELSGDSWRLYDFITRNFIGSISSSLRYTTTTVAFEIGGERFECKGSKVTSKGFALVMHWIKYTDEEENDTSGFHEGDVVTVSTIQLAEGKTSPPDYLTESDLIGLMEKNGIGTDASIPVHINTICQRNYVQVTGSGRRLIPTNLGIVLIHGYQKIDPELSLPTMRSDMEQQLNLIASGKAGHDDVLRYFLSMFAKKFSYFTKHASIRLIIDSMDELFEATFSPLAATSGRPLSKCGKCKRYMKYISLKPNRLHCATCDETYSLPLNGHIKLYKELRCPLDDFELVLYSTGSKGTGYPICPYCYNNPPFENFKKGMACNHCPHPACPHSMVTNAVCPCPESENETDPCKGSLILDATSAPRWKLSCNDCNIVSSFVDTVKNVIIQKDELCECDAVILKVEFRENQNREPITGCIMCDEDMESLLATRFARKSVKRFGGRRGKKKKGRRGKKFDPKLRKLYADMR